MTSLADESGPPMALEVEFVDHQSAVPLDLAPLRLAALTVLAGEGLVAAEVSVSIVNDPTIHELNRRHLQHDYATDVISFVFALEQGQLDGEVIVSADTARREALRLGWPVQAELTLYVVHGLLHLCGYDDRDADSLTAMRRKEEHYLSQLGYTARYDPPAELDSP